MLLGCQGVARGVGSEVNESGVHYLGVMALARWRILRRFPASSVLVSLPGGRREGASAVVKSLSASASHCGEDKVTHTGQVITKATRDISKVFSFLQKWENDDYRNLRFIDREKKVLFFLGAW